MRVIKNIRLKNYDYSVNGYYFVTICTNQSKAYFVNHLKFVVAQFIEQSFDSMYVKGVKLDWFVVMPTHIHLIVILDSCDLKLGEIIRRFKARVSKATGIKIWQPNYYEHVLRNESALFKIREYIQNNPQAKELEFKQFYKDKPDKSGNYEEK